MLPRRTWLAILALALLALINIGIGQTASNPTPLTHASDTAEAVTADTLKPSQCAGLALTSLVYGSGTITGTAANELILGSAAADTVTANAGADCVLSGGGNDTVYGNAGTDVLLGGPNDDRLEGGSEDDTFDGGPNFDICLGDGGTNTLSNCEQTEVVKLLSSWVTGTTHAAVGGSNRALVVVVGHEGATMDLTNVTYGTVGLTQAVEVETASGGTRARVEIWLLNDAGIVAASSSTIALTWSGSPGSVMVDSAFFDGVDQTSMVGPTGTNSNIGDTPTTLSTPALATSDGDMAVYGIVSGNGITFSPLNGFTEGNDQQAGATTTLETGYKESRGPNETPSADADAAPRRLVIAGAILNGAAGTGPSAAVTGTITPSATEAEIVAGAKTIILTLSNETWDATVGADNAITTALINGIDSDRAESTGWDAEVKANMDFNDVTRTSATVVTIALGAETNYDIGQDETITVTIPASAVAGPSAIVAAPTFDIVAAIPTATVSGSVEPSATEAEIVAGSETIVITLTNSTWVAAGAAFDAIRQDIIDGLDSAQLEATGWNAEVRDKQGVGGVVRTSGTVVTITLDTQAAYNNSADETITVTVPASGVTTPSGIVATPTFDITSAAISAAVTGTIAPTATEAEVVAGGKTVIITLTNETWVAAGAAFDAQRQNIIDGLDSAQSELTGWNNEVRNKQGVAGVVRTSATVVTITLDAQAAYDVAADETITVTVPASAVVGVGAIVATPTFDVLTANPLATVSGTVAPSVTEGDVAGGGKTIIITLTNATWDATIGADNALTTALIAGIDSAQSEADGWDLVVKANMDFNDVTRTSGTVVTVTLGAESTYNITASETVTVTAPASTHSGPSDLTATPTFSVNPASAAVSGTVVSSATEADVVAGGKTVIITLTNGSWVAAGAAFDAQRQNIIDGLDSAQSETTGWNTEVRDKQGVAGVVRTSNTVVTITLDAQAAYDITAPETITATVPATAIASAGALTATPTFDIIASVNLLGSWVAGLTHTAEAGDDRVLIVTVHVEHNTTPPTLNGVTYGGQAMTKLVEQTVDTGFTAYTSSWYLDESGIAAASSATIAPSWASAPDVTGYASAFFGNVNQTTPAGASASNTGTASPIATAALTVAEGDMAMYAVSVGNTGTLGANNGFTQGIELTMSSSDGAAAYKQVTADGSETPSASHTSVNRIVIVGWVLQGLYP